MSLKAHQPLHLIFFPNLRNDLHTRTPIANNPYRLPSEIVRPGPISCVVHFPLEGLPPLDIRPILLTQQAQRGNEVMACHALPIPHLDNPDVPALIVPRRLHISAQLHVWCKAMPLDHMLQVSQCLGLLEVVLIPLVRAQVLLVPAVPVDVGLCVAHGAGIPVPEPGAADAGGRIDEPDV